MHLFFIFFRLFEGHQWKNHRKLLNPSFKYKIVNQFIPIFNKHLKQMVQNMAQHEQKDEFDILPTLQVCSLCMICGKTNLIFFFN